MSKHDKPVVVVEKAPEAPKVCRCTLDARQKGDAERQAQLVADELRRSGV